MNKSTKRQRFVNKDKSKGARNFFQFLKWKYGTTKPQWPKKVQVEAYDIPPRKVDGEKLRISYVGHATFLIQTQGFNILTDPVWSLRASPFKNFAGVKRIVDPGIQFEDLPKIDFVLISHNHYDHMDIRTIKKLWKIHQPEFIVPLKNELILKKHIPSINVKSLNWHESIQVHAKLTFHLEPAQHWSRRGLNDLDQTLWGTFIMSTPKSSILFIGDSGYDSTIFKEIGNKFDILLSLIPIGAFEPKWFMGEVHMDPREAVFTHQDLKSKYSIAHHFETFQLANDGFKQAAFELQKAMIEFKISEDKFIIPKIGSAYWLPD